MWVLGEEATEAFIYPRQFVLILLGCVTLRMEMKET
jgi:hypothetical protein